VVSSVADRMKILKSDILNPESENAAVKLALAETHIINETKTYLESQGVLLDSFYTLTGSSHVRRSDTIILVKNIPYGTSAETIREMFEAHGELSRVLIPPAGTIAVVEFIHPDEAAGAFKAVAYRRLGSTIVYLEKGPIGMFKEPASTITEDGPTTVVSTGVKPITIPDEEGAIGDPRRSIAGGTTLFVKNLAFSTTSDGLDRAFRGLPAFAFARVQIKPDPKNHGGKLSMGYGFVGFKDVEGAKRALKSMQGYVLDGHSLSVRLAGRGVEEPGEGEGKTGGKSSTKIIVKNVPFEASKKDIRELFGYVIHPPSFLVSFLTDIHTQRPWAAEIRTPSQEIGPPFTRFRLPRVRFEARSGERFQFAPAYSFTGQTLGATMDGGERARCGCVEEESGCWVWWRRRGTWEEKEVGYRRR